MARILLKYKTEEQKAYTVRGISYYGDEPCLTLAAGLDGYTYLSIPEESIDAYIPQDPKVDLQIVEPDPELLAELRKLGECAQISGEIARKIRQEYPVNREFEALRTNDFEYNQFVEELLAEGKQKKDRILGLEDFDTSGPTLP